MIIEWIVSSLGMVDIQFNLFKILELMVKKIVRIIYSSWIFLLLLVVILGLNGCQSNINSPPRAENGIMDLSEWDISDHNILKLTGEWEFYWHRLLDPKDFNQSIAPEKTGFIRVPMVWNDFSIQGKEIGAYGYGTFRLRILTGSNQGIYGIRIDDINKAYNLYVNGELVLSAGDVGTTRETMIPQYLPKQSYFHIDSSELNIVLQISNFNHRKGGVRSDILFGTANQLQDYRDRNLAFDLFLFGSLILMSLYHFGLFILRRKDKSTLYFGIICFILAIRALLTSEVFLVHLFPNFPYEIQIKLEYYTIYLLLPFFGLFLRNLFPEEIHKRVIQGCIIFSGLFCFIVLLTPVRIYSHTLIPYQVVTLTGSLYAIIALIVAAIRKREGAVLFLIGFVIFAVTIVNDFLVNNEIIRAPYLMPFGLFVFTFSQSIILSIKFAKAFQTVEELSIRLMSLDKLKDEFLANTSHELRTPLNGIIGIAVSLKDGAAGPLNDQVNKNLSLIISSGKRLFNLVNDILDFSRLKNKDIVLALKPVDLYVITELVLTLSKPLVQGRDIQLVNAIDQNLPRVQADENRLQQILHNLIGNAIKFTDRGDVTVSAVHRENIVEIQVKDTGIGIDEAHIEDVFKSFEQLDSSISRQYGGTGLGLSITKHLIELHGGSIRVKSKQGKGSCFIFTLSVYKGLAAIEDNDLFGAIKELEPAVEAENKKEPSLQPSSFQSFATQSKKENNHTPQILVVDDEPVNIQVLLNQLNLEGYKVLTALNGPQAIDIIENQSIPDLIILDIMMPRMSGYKVANILRQKFAATDLPILMLTAKSQAYDIIKGFEAGANDYLTKPFEKEEMLARLKNLLAIKDAALHRSQLVSIKKELEIAQKIQHSILPANIPKIKGLEIATTYLSSEEIGGDFYDVMMDNDNAIGVLLADVSGHGIPAALIASMIKVAFSMEKTNLKAPDQLLYGLNKTLKDIISGQFITISYTYIDRNRKTLWHANGGHCPLYIWRNQSNSIEVIKPKGRIIGYFDDPVYEIAQFPIEIGDRLILFTDGVIECENDKEKLYGVDNLMSFIKENKHLSIEQLLNHLLITLRKWNKKEDVFEDDVTLMVMEIEDQ